MMQPCQNPSCKSYGKPHPNCRCVSLMAEGGKVGFCNQDNIHDANCKYSNHKPEDHEHEIAGYIAKHGFGGLINMKDDSEKYQSSKDQGHKSIEKHINSLFANEALPTVDHSKQHKMIDEWMEKGGITHAIESERHRMHTPSQNFAEGGAVNKEDKSILHQSMIAKSHPEQNMLIQVAKGRVSNYLNAQKPQTNVPKLAFDSEPDQTAQKKKYETAREIASHPLSVLQNVQKGTIDTEHVKHFNAMYPELNNSMQKKLTEKIVRAQVDGEKPSYKVRQGLSLLMGTPLSGEMAPQNIQAAQSVFQQQAQAQPPHGQPQEKPKKKTSALTKSDQAFLTGSQALAARSQKQ